MTISLAENLVKINSIIDYVKTTDAKIKYERNSYSGTAGAPAITVKIIVTNEYDVKDPFSAISSVSAHVNGSALITETNPLTVTNGEVTIHVSDAIAEPITLSLTDSGSTGLDVSHTASILFS